MTETDPAARSACRAASFGPASGRHRAVQPIPRRQDGGASSHAAGDLATGPAILAADRAVLQSGSLAELEQQVLGILAASTQRTVADLQAGELAGDGSLALDSMLAVFVCRIVARVLGPDGWTRLRGNCEPKDLVSVRSVSGVIARLRRAVVVA